MRIAVLDDYQGVSEVFGDWRPLRDQGHEVVVFRKHLGDEDVVADALATFEIICAMRERTVFPASLLARLPNLRLLVTTGSRNAAIDLEATAEHGVTVCGTGYESHPTAEHTWALILALARHIPAEDAGMRKGGWQQTVGRDLHGRVLSVLGLGRLGSSVARIGAAFGMTVHAWSQNLTGERAVECGATLVSRADLFGTADILSVHLVLSKRTRGLVGAAELGLMKSTALLVNTSRGPIVDEAALVDALANGRLAGAALDVYDSEPLSAQHRLRTLSNTVLTPHLGYVTEQAYTTFYRDTVEAILAWLAGRPVRVLESIPRSI